MSIIRVSSMAAAADADGQPEMVGGRLGLTCPVATISAPAAASVFEHFTKLT